jgi:hypothetical protein
MCPNEAYEKQDCSGERRREDNEPNPTPQGTAARSGESQYFLLACLEGTIPSTSQNWPSRGCMVRGRGGRMGKVEDRRGARWCGVRGSSSDHHDSRVLRQTAQVARLALLHLDVTRDLSILRLPLGAEWRSSLQFDATDEDIVKRTELSKGALALARKDLSRRGLIVCRRQQRGHRTSSAM